MTELLNLKLGCDPELLVYSKSTGLIMPVCGLIGHGKKDPLPIGDGIKVQEDGVALEFNVDPIDYIESQNTLGLVASKAIDKINYWLRTANQKAMDLGLTCVTNKSEFLFNASQLTDPRANTIGCDPDFDAWRGGLKRPGWEVQNFSNYRFCGGHIHLGFPKDKVEIPDYALVQLIDALGESTLYYQGVEVGGRERSSFYGMPGIYRPKPYGIEYRTPNNQWIFRTGIEVRAANIVFWAINNQKKAYEVYTRIDQAAAQHKDNGRPGGGGGWEANYNLYVDNVLPYIEQFISKKKSNRDVLFQAALRDAVMPVAEADVLQNEFPPAAADFGRLDVEERAARMQQVQAEIDAIRRNPPRVFVNPPPLRRR